MTRNHGLTVVEAVLLLLPVLLSGVVEETVAVLLRIVPPGALTWTTMVTVAELGKAMLPRFAWAVPLGPPATRAQLPTLGVQEMNVTPAGNGSSTWTRLAGFGPRLLTVRV